VSGALDEIREEFLAIEQRERLQLLLEFSQELPPLPERYVDHPDLLERVEECQSPVFIFTEVDDEARVHLHATAPREAPTTRGFASILAQGLDGLRVDEVLAVGDKAFREKCYARIEELLAGGRTLFFVSHSERDLLRFCTRGLYLDKGALVMDGAIKDVVARYNAEYGV